jgi:type II secretory ATPase GspE/PulE/Tfp pilus assembly ATPase PilB-like protein
VTENIERVLKSITRGEEEHLASRMAGKLGMGYINLTYYPILPDALRLIPEAIARQYHLVAYLKVDQVIRVATSRPAGTDLAKALTILKDTSNLTPQLYLASESSIRYALKLYAKLPSLAHAESEVVVGEESQKNWQAEIQNLHDLKQKIGAVPTTELLDLIFTGAIQTASSDIHLEPTPDGLRIRYRIDGVLQEVAMLDSQAYKALRSRIKYLARLKLDVKQTPQDGRFSAKASGQPIDVRVSLIPGPQGEYIVLRLLLHNQGLLRLDQLGIRPDALAAIRTAIKKPHGIIFNTGPTGSGKTTTLYAILAELNQPGVKIVTLEDPIEYKISGIDQSQVESEQGYTFAKGLRSILRQDPDIILVGEIRDTETASTAIHAALTGHLVLTTLHTNSAAATLPRLIDMGVPPFLLAGSINLIIGQRLVRRVCSTCRGTATDPEKPGAVCPKCSGTGYRGRIAIIEVLVPDETINRLIVAKAPLADFEAAAVKSGMLTMQQDGLMKVSQGLTTNEEIDRVTDE